jgi:hypothetical protein
MARLCERPGCSVPASVAYGFEAERYLVWVESVRVIEDDDIRSGVLCRRHADALTPPRGWWLDDRRIPAPQLFPETARPRLDVPKAASAENAGGGATRRRRAGMSPKRDDLTSELPFDDIVEAARDLPEPLDPVVVVDVVVLGEAVVAEDVVIAEDVVVDLPVPDETKAIPWSPQFDHNDDLGGVLNVRSRLLSRAFRGLNPNT